LLLCVFKVITNFYLVVFNTYKVSLSIEYQLDKKWIMKWDTFSMFEVYVLSIWLPSSPLAPGTPRGHGGLTSMAVAGVRRSRQVAWRAHAADTAVPCRNIPLAFLRHNASSIRLFLSVWWCIYKSVFRTIAL
jgi:hypothetical protein